MKRHVFFLTHPCKILNFSLIYDILSDERYSKETVSYNIKLPFFTKPDEQALYDKV
jgi:hypothetical protein